MGRGGGEEGLLGGLLGGIGRDRRIYTVPKAGL